MFGFKLPIPSDLVPRLKEVGQKHGFSSAQKFADHLVTARLSQYDIPESTKKLKAQLDFLVEEHGYSDRDEVVMHLLERGLKAYEEPAASREDLEARLRGLGYIE